MIETNQDRLLLDARYYALFEANRVWKLTYLATQPEKIELVKDIYKLRTFSLNQIAKICRLSPSTVSRRHPANSPGGRFEPESLTTLMVIRKLVTDLEPIESHLVQMVVKAGTSVNEVARLTGAPASTMYNQAREFEEAA